MVAFALPSRFDKVKTFSQLCDTMSKMFILGFLDIRRGRVPLDEDITVLKKLKSVLEDVKPDTDKGKFERLALLWAYSSYLDFLDFLVRLPEDPESVDDYTDLFNLVAGRVYPRYQYWIDKLDGEKNFPQDPV